MTWRSGTSIRGDHPSKKGDKVLNRAKGNRQNQALIAMAGRRCDVLSTMLRDMTLNETPQLKAV